MEKSTNWVEIDLTVVKSNVEYVLRKTQTPLMAVVKANAYGHGALRLLPVLVEAGVHWLGVAHCSEALALRAAGCKLPILVFGPTLDGEEIRVAIEKDVTLTLPGPEYAPVYSQAARATGGSLAVHLKIDTGMGRLGVLPEEALALAQCARSEGGISLTGIYSHFAVVDEEFNHPLTKLQLERFTATLQLLEKDGFRFEWVHCSNSGSLETLPASYFNLGRCGSTIYGLMPTFFQPYPEAIRPALTWKARLVSCKKLPQGWAVGYGQEYLADGKETIGVVAVGYADGFRRAKHNRLLVGGKIVPVVGRVNMDYCMVSLDEPLPAGTEVVIIGSQGIKSLIAQDHANDWGTIDADVTAQINARVPRIYLNDR
jgi:alanine racemase